MKNPRTSLQQQSFPCKTLHHAGLGLSKQRSVSRPSYLERDPFIKEHTLVHKKDPRTASLNPKPFGLSWQHTPRPVNPKPSSPTVQREVCFFGFYGGVSKMRIHVFFGFRVSNSGTLYKPCGTSAVSGTLLLLFPSLLKGPLMQDGYWATQT